MSARSVVHAGTRPPGRDSGQVHDEDPAGPSILIDPPLTAAFREAVIRLWLSPRDSRP